MQVLCPEIDISDLEWLYDITGGNIFRIDTELQKIKSFHYQQKNMFDLIRSEGGYVDLNQSTIYDFIKYFINRKRLFKVNEKISK